MTEPGTPVSLVAVRDRREQAIQRLSDLMIGHIAPRKLEGDRGGARRRIGGRARDRDDRPCQRPFGGLRKIAWLAGGALVPAIVAGLLLGRPHREQAVLPALVASADTAAARAAPAQGILHLQGDVRGQRGPG